MKHPSLFFALVTLLTGCATTSTHATPDPVASQNTASTTTALLGPGETPNGGLIDTARLDQQPGEFFDVTPAAWLKTPTTLASARGHVVLIESWHRL